ncbi:MAG: glycosyltransferase family 2 protein [Zetaproteobacteria bacterium]|nr:MAG: glycosyltransferase family 2 protein [Zetaproteobacteria bacterium]
MHELKRYIERARIVPRIPDEPARRLGMVVVVPCRQEPDLIALLDHLQNMKRPDAHVEVVLVLNHEQGVAEEVARAHRRDALMVRAWDREYGSEGFRAHVIEAFDLPPKYAGVGLARKLGMDEAVYRFVRCGQPNGIIASLDADCRVDDDYLLALPSAFHSHRAHAVVLPYAHDLRQVVDERHHRAMVFYELFLRYVELGWRWAMLPYAFTSIGSCFAVRADAYARHHGMNRRKAGEDFYFLHKLARERPLIMLSSPRVYPSSRMSSRTPFGTGQAVRDWYLGGDDAWPVAPPSVFDELRELGLHAGELFHMPLRAWLDLRSRPLSIFLLQAGLESAVDEMRRHAASPETFRRRFFVWFDGLKAWRYVQHAEQTVPVDIAVAELAARLGWRECWSDATALLRMMRAFMLSLASHRGRACRVRPS